MAFAMWSSTGVTQGGDNDRTNPATADGK
jgi:hypothetical protein